MKRMCVFTYLPKVANDGSVSPTMFSIKAHCSILKDNQVERLIKPPKEIKHLKLRVAYLHINAATEG